VTFVVYLSWWRITRIARTRTGLPSTASTRRARRPGASRPPSRAIAGHDGKPRKSVRVRDRVATKLLNARQVEIDGLRGGLATEANIEFPDRADEFIGQTKQRVATGRLKQGTVRAYKETIEVAKPAIGWVHQARRPGKRRPRVLAFLVDALP
jgi:hypothetical protein